MAEVQAVAYAPHAIQVVPEVTKPTAEHPVTHATFVLEQAVHTPEMATKPVEQDVAYGVLHILVPGKQATHAPFDTTNLSLQVVATVVEVHVLAFVEHLTQLGVMKEYPVKQAVATSALAVQVEAPAAVHLVHTDLIKEYPSIHDVYAVALVHTATPVEQAVQDLSVAKKNAAKHTDATEADVQVLAPFEQAIQAPAER